MDTNLSVKELQDAISSKGNVVIRVAVSPGQDPVELRVIKAGLDSALCQFDADDDTIGSWDPETGCTVLEACSGCSA